MKLATSSYTWGKLNNLEDAEKEYVDYLKSLNM